MSSPNSTADSADPTVPITRLREIMHTLRAPGGCPWDAEQTHKSLIPNLIEEAYETAEALRSGDRDHMVEELGDLLLQVVFHAEMAQETGAFDFDDIADAISDKLVRRHPHVFGDAAAGDSAAVLRQWDQIKQAEKAANGQPAEGYHLEKANEGLPALMAATKIQKQAAKVGFDWPDLTPVLAKIREELDEVEAALDRGGDGELEEEIGDLLFAVVNLSRKQDMDAESLLAAANSKFVKRFQQVEDRLREKGKVLSECSLQEMDAEWEAIKGERQGT